MITSGDCCLVAEYRSPLIDRVECPILRVCGAVVATVATERMDCPAPIGADSRLKFKTEAVPAVNGADGLFVRSIANMVFLVVYGFVPPSWRVIGNFTGGRL